MSEVLEASMLVADDLRGVERGITHALRNLRFRQTSSYGPRAEGFAYAEVPDWLLRQWLEAVTAANNGGKHGS